MDFPRGKQKVQILENRSCFSGREFHVASPRQTQQAFLESHALAFEWFDGVFHTLRYDDVPRNIIAVMCPSPKCARPRVDAGLRQRSKAWTAHNEGLIG